MRTKRNTRTMGEYIYTVRQWDSELPASPHKLQDKHSSESIVRQYDLVLGFCFPCLPPSDAGQPGKERTRRSGAPTYSPSRPQLATSGLDGNGMMLRQKPIIRAALKSRGKTAGSLPLVSTIL